MQKNIFMTLTAIAISSATFIACDSTKTATSSTTPTASNDQSAASNSQSTSAASNQQPAPATASKDVVDIAIGSPDHTTLVAAVTAAGLVQTLKGTGPFTVFAPTNAAFAALPAGTVEGLVKPENKTALTNILTYHVVAGAVKAADLKDGQTVKTLQGQDLTVSIRDGKVSINGANVSAADLIGTNGVVHVIDAVILPKN